MRSHYAHNSLWSSDAHPLTAASFEDLVRSLHTSSWRKKQEVRVLLTLLLQQGLQSVTTHCAAFDSYLMHAPQILN